MLHVIIRFNNTHVPLVDTGVVPRTPASPMDQYLLNFIGILGGNGGGGEILNWCLFRS